MLFRSAIHPNQNLNGYHVNLSTIAIIKHSKNYEHALKFISFLLSPKIQKYFVEHNYEESVNINEAHTIYKADINLINHIYKNAENAIKIAEQVKWQ